MSTKVYSNAAEVQSSLNFTRLLKIQIRIQPSIAFYNSDPNHHSSKIQISNRTLSISHKSISEHRSSFIQILDPNQTRQDSGLDSILKLFAHHCSVCIKNPLPLSLIVLAVAHRTRSVADKSTGPEEALTLPAINCSNISSDLVDG